MAIGFSARLRRGVRGSLLRGRRLLVDAIFGEAVVQVGALGRVIDYFEAFPDLSTSQARALTATAAGVQATRTVGLGVVAALGLATGVLPANEVVDADDLDLRGVALISARSVLANATPLEATVEEFLLAFELLLQLRHL